MASAPAAEFLPRLPIQKREQNKICCTSTQCHRKLTLPEVQTTLLVFPGPVRSGFAAIFGWTATATGCLYIESVKKPDRTDKKPQKTGPNQLQLVILKTGPPISCDRL